MIDLVSIVATVLLLMGYQVFLHLRLRRDPLFTVHALNRFAREAWIDTAFFYSVPLVFWMFGPNFMLAATVLLIAVLYPLDRAPKAGIRAADSAAPQSPAVAIAKAGEERAHNAGR